MGTRFEFHPRRAARIHCIRGRRHIRQGRLEIGVSAERIDMNALAIDRDFTLTGVFRRPV